MKLLTTKEVAEILRKQPDTIAKWRKLKKGPPWFIIEGQIFYDYGKLLEWIKEKQETINVA